MEKFQHNDLQEHLMRLARMMRRSQGGERHISRSGIMLLKVVLEEEGIRTSELAQRLDIRPSSLTDLLKSMEESGDITREKDERDSRVIRVYATEQAKAALARRQAERAKQAERLRACLSEEEYSSFCAICDKLSAALEAEQGGAGCANGHGHGHGCHGGKGHGRHACHAHAAGQEDAGGGL